MLDAINLGEPGMAVEVEFGHFGGRLEVDGLEPTAPDAPGSVEVDESQLVLPHEGHKRIRRERLTQVCIFRLVLVLVAIIKLVSNSQRVRIEAPVFLCYHRTRVLEHLLLVI